jgi:hypothetical protein
LAAVLVLALAALDQAARPIAGGSRSPAGGGAWIWSADSPRDESPRAFYLVHDFDLEAKAAEASVAVLGDEEYVLHLNGFRVGSNRYSPGSPLDRYRVGPLLVPGGNRLVAEVRSGRGTGGFLLRLEGGGHGPTLAATDGTWKVFRRYHPGLLGGWVPLTDGEPARVWGRPPVGRWGRPQAGEPRPVFAPPEVAPAGGGAVAATPIAAPSTADTPAGRSARWFDFGRVVEGYLALRFAGGETGPALFCAATAPPESCGAEADGYALVPAGAPFWEDSLVRRFRYAAFVGLPAEAGALAIPVGAGGPAAAAPVAAEASLLGIELPPRPTPVERAVERRLSAEASRR